MFTHDPRTSSERPLRKHRIILASVLAVLTVVFLGAAPAEGEYRSDFSLIWFGAKALLNGADPYNLVGPGRIYDSPWYALYPAPAYILGMPFTSLSEFWATNTFVGASTFLLAVGLTRDGWYRLPLFLSVPFLWSVAVGQWSIILTAALFLPQLAFIAIAKPQLMVPVAIGAAPRLAVYSMGLVGSALVVASLVLLPTWPLEWFNLARRAEHLGPPFLAFGGPATLLVLLRWRRREAWFILLLSLMPQAAYPYSVLPLLVIPMTLRESCVLSLLASIGAIVPGFIPGDLHSPALTRISAILSVWTVYLPAVLIVLQRSNAVSGFPWKNGYQPAAR